MALRPEVIRYGDHPSQFCELFEPPPGGGPPPVAVLVHGGLWRQRYGCGLQWGVARDLVARGWVAWNVEYRRLGRGGGGGWPVTFEDAAAAVDALAELDDRVDLERVIAIGHSAGGQMAVWAAARGDARVRITRVVAQAGILDLYEPGRAAAWAVHELLQGTPAEVPHRYATVAPIKRLPIGVPMLVVHGARDELIPVHVSREFAAAATAAGDECELVVIDDAGHYEHLEPGSRCWSAVTEWI